MDMGRIIRNRILLRSMVMASYWCPLHALGIHDCFPENYKFDYIDCCQFGGRFGQVDCFAGDFSYESCCTFEFGQNIRDVPSVVHSHAELFAGSIGSISLQADHCNESLSGLCGAEYVWYEGYILARFVEVLPREPLRLLDIGCGLGLTTIAAASFGHYVLATDFDQASLNATHSSLETNGVKSNVDMLWFDVWKAPPPTILSHEPFDLVFFSASLPTILKPQIENRSVRDSPIKRKLSRSILEEKSKLLVARLLRLPVAAFVFPCREERTGYGPDAFCAPVFDALKRAGSRSQEDCRTLRTRAHWLQLLLQKLGGLFPPTTGCQRKPGFVSLQHMEDTGLLPPSRWQLLVF